MKRTAASDRPSSSRATSHSEKTSRPRFTSKCHGRKPLGIYDRLFGKREKGDYADLVRFDPDEVSDWYDEAREFVEIAGDIVKKELDTH